MTSLTAAPVSGATVRITYTKDPGVSGDHLTLYRVDQYGLTPVMGAINLPNESNVWDDPEAPLNTSFTYRLIAGATTINTDPITVTGPTNDQGQALPLLSDPYRGVSSPVILLEMGELQHEARADVLNVEGRRDRIVIVDVESSPTASPRLLTETTDQVTRLDSIFAPGTPVLLRVPCPGIRDRWLTLTRGRVIKPFASEAKPSRIHDLGTCETAYSAVEPARRAAGDTLGDLAQAVPTTLEAINSTWATLGAIAATDLKALA